MKKIAKDSGLGRGFRLVLSRKKKKSVALEEGVGKKGVLTKVPSDCLWGSKTDDTTKSESIDMEEKCLVEKTSFDYGKSEAIVNEDYDQMPKRPDVKTKKVLGKPLGRIDFLSHSDDNDNILLNVILELPSPLKNLVTISVRKSFTLDISLNKVVGKSSQEKLMVIRRLFSKVNGFGEASTPLKFSGIIYASFTSEFSLAQATKKARVANILVNTDLKKLTGCCYL